MEDVLTARSLFKSYGGPPVLDGLDMTVPRGAIYGLVGRNGAGKTTLIRVLGGLQCPDAGEYAIFGVDSRDREIAKARRRMGAVVETPSIYLDMTAENNLKQQYRILGLPDFSGIPELLELVGLKDTGRKKAKNFSLGMKQRLGIAVALCGDPDFLMLDEPVNGLDPQGIIEVRELIIRLNRERGITVLISSHILDELSRLATHYGFIHRGRMVREMSAEELEANARKCMRLTVSDTAALATVLEDMGAAYKIISGDKADVFESLNVTALTLALHERGCEVRSIEERDESLESFFINLVGGGHDA